jgi:uncharacterized transporter YbjL
LHLGVGYGAGVFGGACTISSVLGVATEAIRQLRGSPALRQEEINAMSIAFAITYIFGTAGASVFLALLGPKIPGVNLPAECKALETAMGGNEPDPSVHSAYHTIGVRAYRVTDPVFAEVSVSEFESRFPNQRLFIERLRQNNKIVESTPETTIRQNDVLAIASRPRICYKKPKEEQTSSTSADCFSRRQLQKCYKSLKWPRLRLAQNGSGTLKGKKRTLGKSLGNHCNSNPWDQRTGRPEPGLSSI